MRRSHLVARNVVTTLATQVITWALTFAVLCFLPRYVGDVGLGKLATAAAFVGVAFVLVPLGTSTVLIKEIAQDHGSTGNLLSAAVVMRIALGILVSLCLIGFVDLLHYTPLFRMLVLVYSCGMLIAAVDNAFASALQGQDNFSRQNFSALINKVLASILTIVLVLNKAPLWALAASVGIANVVSLLVNIAAFHSLRASLKWPSRSMMHGLAMRGMPFMGWIAFTTLYGKTDPIVLERVTNLATVGWYAVAFRLIGTTLFLPSAITLALLPTLTRMHKESAAGFQELARRTLTLVMLCGIPIALVCILLPGRLIAMMHYPAAFQNSIPVLQVGGFGVLLWFAANVLGTLVVASDGQKKMFHTSMIGTIIGIPACIACSYITNRFSGNGATGAMFSDVALELFLVLCYLRILPAGMFNVDSVKMIAKSIVAALPMALFIWFASHYWGFWIAIPGIAIYIVMCWMLGCLQARDLAFAKQAFASKLGRSG